LRIHSQAQEHGVEIVGEVKKSTGGTFAKFKDIDGNEFLLKSD